MNRSVLVVLMFFAATPLWFASSTSARQSGQATEANPPGSAEHITIPAGGVISVRIADAVDSNHNHTGDLLTGIVDPSVLINDLVVIPRGTEAHVRLVQDKKGGHVAGKAEVRLELVSLVLNGHQLGVESSDHEKKEGTLAGKAKKGTKPVAGAGADAALSGPGAGMVGGVIAVFSAAKVELKPNSRVEFMLTEPFAFVPPPPAPSSQQP